MRHYSSMHGNHAGAIVVSNLDIVAIDRQFEVLLDLSAQEREEELALIRAQQPERERALRKLLKISAEAHTLVFAVVGESLPADRI